MKIAIVGGTGSEGYGLALRWARSGEHVVIGSRDEQRALAAAEKLQKEVGGSQISGAENQQAVAGADVVVLTVPFQAHAATVRHIKPALKPGAIVIDATVPLATAVGGKVTQTIGVWDGSAAQQAQNLLPAGIAVVAAFQNVSADLLNDDRTLECDVIICTDDTNARQVVTDLVHKIPGLRALDGGALENAHIVEQITALLITLNIRHKSHSAGLRITGLDEPSRRTS
ncbi:MAG TPA: NADPH-dependent F420 reductase [Terriglobales bacterium]|nr:NADPH-dependent F420 reductase [Terriglobales bacterium]